MLAAAEEEEEEARSQTDGLAACKPTHVSPLLTTTVLTQPAAPSTSTQQKAQKSLPKYHKVSYFSLILIKLFHFSRIPQNKLWQRGSHLDLAREKISWISQPEK